MNTDCVLCNPNQDPEQQIILENDHCFYIQKPSEQEVLVGSGLIIPKNHVETPFDLSPQEWAATKELMDKAKTIMDEAYSPDGYSLGWNVNPIGGQHIPHAHFHIIPRFEDEPYAGRGIRYWIKQKENKRP
ncbi:HIT family protein [Pontibacillus marinus]|uniref:Cell-cycle regulation histidine triad protein n=1 Tax=Pontibacillus marinus BH030004 = DSM 16465 TaxID=1385511 RepID=A0A0A5G8V4_9BACI|nr:HIT domain-containing protein [Pontibacillus marinus]KGX89571.1 cell-cycle regulation histidine triad protein [Pontibacillus marinus BH030004 = DSM 16465]